MSKVSAQNVEHSSTEIVSIADNAKASHLRDVYVKLGDEENLFCSVISMVCIDTTRIVVVDVAEQQNSRFTNPEANVSRMFRIKLVDTKVNEVLSEVKVPGQFKGMAKINESQVAVWLDGYEMILMKVGETLTADRRLTFNAPSELSHYEVTGVSCHEDHVYVCRANTISKFIMKGKVTEEKVAESIAEDRFNKQHFLSNAVYKDGNKTLMYAILRNVNKSIRASYFSLQGPATLAHGTGKEKSMDKLVIPGNPKSITMDDEGGLLFVHTQLYTGSDDKMPFQSIYVLRAGTTDGRVVLSEEDGLRHVTAVSYCSKTRELFVAMEESNYVKVYQLSGVH